VIASDAIPAAPSAQGLSPRQWAVVITASLGALLEIIDTSITNVALVDIQANLGATLAEVGWVITGYAMATVVMIPLSDWLSGVFGQRGYFMFSLVGFTAASMLCGLAPNLSWLVVARILQGLLGGGLLPKAQAIIFRAVPKELQGMTQGIFGIGGAGWARDRPLPGRLPHRQPRLALDLLHQPAVRDPGGAAGSGLSGARPTGGQGERERHRWRRHPLAGHRPGEPANGRGAGQPIRLVQ
jgi:hypothetical protein